MKKQYYIDMWIAAGLTPKQIEQVLCQVTGFSREELFLCRDISSKYIYEVGQKFYDFSLGKQEEYSLQTANFYGKDFFVDERVLIPRNDTELLVDVALKKIHRDIDVRETIYVDIGTGSWCVALSLLSEMVPLEFLESYACDISPEALEVAHKNRDTHALRKLELVSSYLLTFLAEKSIRGKSLCCTANLPYIRDGDYENMNASVYSQEPKQALFWGPDTGFELYQKCIKQCFELKHIHALKDIHLFIEIGYDQREHSQKFLEELGLLFEYFPDSATIDRVIHITGF